MRTRWRRGCPGRGTVKRLDFRGGEPRIPIRLMEGRREVTFSSRGRMRLRFGGPDDKVLDAAAGTRVDGARDAGRG
ncbi:hypothetical protein ACLESD_53370, partial [Pyxidicoccus sp. 3LFB2]